MVWWGGGIKASQVLISNEQETQDFLPRTRHPTAKMPTKDSETDEESANANAKKARRRND